MMLGRFFWWLVAVAILALGTIALIAILPPAHFPVNQIVAVAPGSTVIDLAKELRERGVVRSARVYSYLARHFRAGELKAGYYEFERPLPVFAVVERLNQGIFTFSPVKITIPEGWSNEKIAVRLAERLSGFDEVEFLRLAEPWSGQLFPDTYFFPPHTDPATAIAILQSQFKNQIADLLPKIEAAGRTLPEVLGLAALIEGEVPEIEDRRLVAGILWKRYDSDHLLQVDVATSTYETLGLPTRPIANPGLEAIRATLEVTDSPFWFYLSDEDGVTRYAKTYAEHQANIAKYLRD